MLNIAADHINAAEAKEASFRAAEQEHTEKVRMIGVLQRTIADAERRKVEPIFASEEAATTFQWMSDHVAQMAAEYQNGLCHARQSGRGCKLDLSNENAIAFFFGDLIMSKLPALASQINSRDGRGHVVCRRQGQAGSLGRLICRGVAKRYPILNFAGREQGKRWASLSGLSSN